VPARKKTAKKVLKVKKINNKHPIPYLAISVGVIGILLLFVLANNASAIPVLGDLSFDKLPKCNLFKAKLEKTTLNYSSNVMVVDSSESDNLVQCSYSLVNPSGKVVYNWKDLAAPEKVKYRWCKNSVNLKDVSRKAEFTYPVRGEWKVLMHPVMVSEDRTEGKACLASFKVN